MMIAKVKKIEFLLSGNTNFFCLFFLELNLKRKNELLRFSFISPHSFPAQGIATLSLFC